MYMMQSPALLFLAAGMALPSLPASAQMPKVSAAVHSQALHAGKINPMLFGNFIELLDDVAPGMWAELLNDRSFEGIVPPANWCYFDGSPDICDRPWDTNGTWTLDTEAPFNGARSARLTAGPGPASLTQSGLAARKGMGYRFSGYLRSDSAVKAAVLLKCLLPTGQWMTLARAELPGPFAGMEKVRCRDDLGGGNRPRRLRAPRRGARPGCGRTSSR